MEEKKISGHYWGTNNKKMGEKRMGLLCYPDPDFFFVGFYERLEKN